MSNQSISFVAKYRAVIIEATQKDGVYGFNISERFVPVNESYRPYNLTGLPDSVARQIIHGSSAVDLIPSYGSFNVDLSSLLVPAGFYSYRIFDDTPIQEGDSILVLFQQMESIKN